MGADASPVSGSIGTDSALIAALVLVAIVAAMLLRARRRRSDVLFAVFAGNLVIWFLAVFFRGAYGVVPARAELAIAALVPATLLTLYADLLTSGGPGPGRAIAGVYPSAAILAILCASPLGNLHFIPWIVGGYVGVTVLITAQVVVRSSRHRKGTVEHVRLRYLAFGAVITVLLTLLGRLGTPAGTALGNLAVMVYVFFLSQVILRDRLLDLQELFGRMVVLGVLALLFGAISSIIALVSESSTTSARVFNTMVTVIILLTLFEPLKARLEGKTVELFFRERHDFERTIGELRRTTLRFLDPGRMSRLVLDTLYDERRCTHGAIYLLEEPLGRGFRLESHVGPEPAPRVSERFHPALWHAINKDRAPILVEQLLRANEEQGPEGGAKHDMIEAMRGVSADVLLPFVSGDRVLGFLALRDDRVLEPYSTEEIALLMSLAESAVTVLENSQLARRLTERDRLAAIGEMAAGLAHEIRNPLGAIKGAAEYLEPSKLPGEDGELLQVIIDESNRLNGVVSQFLDYARPFRANFAPTNINDIVKKTAKLVDAKDRKLPPIELDFDPRVVEIDADAEQIKQVILNLVLNAIESTGDKGTAIRIFTRMVNDRERVEIGVRDHGGGIPPEALDHIFIPFFTTKAQGTGLGLAVCQRIITNHGGEIRVQSQVGEGTEFVVRLPTRRRSMSTTGSFNSPKADEPTNAD